MFASCTSPCRHAECLVGARSFDLSVASRRTGSCTLSCRRADCLVRPSLSLSTRLVEFNSLWSPHRVVLSVSAPWTRPLPRVGIPVVVLFWYVFASCTLTCRRAECLVRSSLSLSARRVRFAVVAAPNVLSALHFRCRRLVLSHPVLVSI